jgi:hypothetical protein
MRVHAVRRLQVCAICLEAPEDPVTLPCRHAYCAACVSALRERQVKQLCPLCRKPLQAQPADDGGGVGCDGGGGLGDDLYDEATRLFVPVQRAVERGSRGRAPGGWENLPPLLQADVDRCACVGGWGVGGGRGGVGGYMLGRGGTRRNAFF